MLTGLFSGMRRGLFVLSALVAGACGAPRSEAEGVSSAKTTQRHSTVPNADLRAGTTDDTVVLSAGGSVKVTVDEARLGNRGTRDVKVLARHGTLVALSDAYPSKPRGAGLCQAGQETWFRVIDTSMREERYARIVDSCVGEEQWGDPLITVTQDGAKIRLNLLSEPVVDLTLGSDGRVTAGR